MFKSSAQKVLLKKRSAKESRNYLEKGTLRMSRSACVCMTCQHFRYSCDRYSHTILTCHAHHRLIPQGSHLTSSCPRWHKNFEDKYTLCSEVA
ncbi:MULTISPECIES: hypothetical protein [Prochlorococcus]|uniref:hypothetical protein n=1 Tax=Prochlorococcus TaxID=1218 RepID=UPI0002D62822|nr:MULTISPECIES: hypothetical protein [Prochlorococcus]